MPDLDDALRTLRDEPIRAPHPVDALERGAHRLRRRRRIVQGTAMIAALTLVSGAALTLANGPSKEGVDVANSTPTDPTAAEAEIANALETLYSPDASAADREAIAENGAANTRFFVHLTDAMQIEAAELSRLKREWGESDEQVGLSGTPEVTFDGADRARATFFVRFTTLWAGEPPVRFEAPYTSTSPEPASMAFVRVDGRWLIAESSYCPATGEGRGTYTPSGTHTYRWAPFDIPMPPPIPAQVEDVCRPLNATQDPSAVAQIEDSVAAMWNPQYTVDDRIAAAENGSTHRELLDRLSTELTTVQSKLDNNPHRGDNDYIGFDPDADPAVAPEELIIKVNFIDADHADVTVAFRYLAGANGDPATVGVNASGIGVVKIDGHWVVAEFSLCDYGFTVDTAAERLCPRGTGD